MPVKLVDNLEEITTIQKQENVINAGSQSKSTLKLMNSYNQKMLDENDGMNLNITWKRYKVAGINPIKVINNK